MAVVGHVSLGAVTVDTNIAPDEPLLIGGLGTSNNGLTIHVLRQHPSERGTLRCLVMKATEWNKSARQMGQQQPGLDKVRSDRYPIPKRPST